MTFQELLVRMVWQAQRGGPKFEMAEEEAIAIAETMFPQIADAASQYAASSPQTRPLLRRTVTITMADGEGAIPDAVLVPYVGCDSSLLDPTNTSKRYAYKQWHEFVTKPATPLGLYSVLGESRLFQREPNALYVAGEGFSDDMELTTPCTVQRPATATTAMDCVPDVETLLINTGAEMLRGELASKAVLA